MSVAWTMSARTNKQIQRMNGNCRRVTRPAVINPIFILLRTYLVIVFIKCSNISTLIESNLTIRVHAQVFALFITLSTASIIYNIHTPLPSVTAAIRPVTLNGLVWVHHQSNCRSFACQYRKNTCTSNNYRWVQVVVFTNEMPIITAFQLNTMASC